MNDMTTNNSLPSISSRLVIKNIPEKFSNDQLIELINKNFENRTKDITIIKLEHKYSKNNKLCFLTTDNLDTRKEIIQFFNGFELIDPKGFKQKLSIIDCLYQNAIKTQKDKIHKTIDQIDHFNKFKEYLATNKLIDFKNEESKFTNGIFKDVEEIETTTSTTTKSDKQGFDSDKKKRTKEETNKQSLEKKPGKTIITKKINTAKDNLNINKESIPEAVILTAANTSEISTKNQFPIINDIEVITTVVSSAEDGLYNSNKNKKENYKGNYNKKQGQDNYYNNYGDKTGNYYDKGSYNYNKNDYGNTNSKNYDNYYDNSSGNYYNGYDNSYKQYDNNYYNNDYNYKKGYRKGGYK